MLEIIFIFLTNLTNSIISIIKILITSHFFLPKYSFDEEDCFIFGNGPSLNAAMNENDWSQKSKTLLCVNGFSLTEQFEKFKPSYYIINAPEFWSKDAYIGQAYKEQRSTLDKMIQFIVDKTTWDMTVFLPVQSMKNKAFVQYLRSNPFIKLSFFNTTPAEGITIVNHFLFSSRLGSPRPHNVLVSAILIAINSGAKKIHLLGADHSWLPLISVNDNNMALINQKHFYDDDRSKSKPMQKQGKAPRRLHEILEKFMLSFRAYFELKEYAETRGVKIYNCTPNSFIDAFERKDIKEVLSK